MTVEEVTDEHSPGTSSMREYYLDFLDTQSSYLFSFELLDVDI
jgi:hypothetical protein